MLTSSIRNVERKCGKGIDAVRKQLRRDEENNNDTQIKLDGQDKHVARVRNYWSKDRLDKN